MQGFSSSKTTKSSLYLEKIKHTMKSIDISEFKVSETITLTDTPTVYNLETDSDTTKKELRKVRKKLGKLQDTLYAHGKYAVLICIQGMDTAGKDSMIREVFKDFNSRGVVVHSFKVPTPKELAHDYIWRHYIALPERGKFGIFNRTHYENVLVTRVHPGYILGENIPSINSIEDINDDCKALVGASVDIWQCDAKGNYSEYANQLDGDFTNEHFLRGRQTTNTDGEVSFISIFPGWYPGRAPHLHLEIKSSSGESLLVTQTAFPEDISTEVYTTSAYKGDFDTSNTNDGGFSNSLEDNMADEVTGNLSDGFTMTKIIRVKAK